MLLTINYHFTVAKKFPTISCTQIVIGSDQYTQSHFFKFTFASNYNIFDLQKVTKMNTAEKCLYNDIYLPEIS